MILDVCSWDNPGHNPYTGSVEYAVANMDIPSHERAALIKAIKNKDYVDLVVITKNDIKGITDRKYEPNISNMHFGSKGVVCKTVTRNMWPAKHIERAMVFETPTVTVIWPSACGNYSVIHKVIDKKPEHPPVEPRDPKEPQGPIPVPEPWMFPAILAYAAYFTFKRK